MPRGAIGKSAGATVSELKCDSRQQQLEAQRGLVAVARGRPYPVWKALKRVEDRVGGIPMPQ